MEKGFSHRVKKANEPSVLEIYNGILRSERAWLARGITLLESKAHRHQQQAQDLLSKVLSHTGKSIRIGITGVPGVGKSTFIEALGLYLCEKGHRVAVLAVDPSSSLSGGSILGDKTRMEQLSNHPNAFIRPSPTAGTLGGVHRKTRETIYLCEASGYDIILIETVGVGQSEFSVRSMVDFFLLLVLTGAGDELQGMKKGIMELTDCIVVNKADGENQPLAEKTKAEYNQILHFLAPATPGWEAQAFTCSSIKEQGLEEIWQVIERFKVLTIQSNQFQKRRKQQNLEWLQSSIVDNLLRSFYEHQEVKRELPLLKTKVEDGETTVQSALLRLLNLYQNKE
ncbi:methylmalonyl Co-A mutase-associated GTPase MeaB [Bacillus sp. 2205SS5-2]|uniref:methylmalonyl Co-A mutase-associated GTPase MeaB n=1 Tax=Bacillus sp. 2205SS5-2 TaxID=3109031 RepID=UPI00300458B4